MSEFGAALARCRRARGWTQRDLVGQLAGQFSRSSVAGVESGREQPSPRMWSALAQVLPEAVEELRPLYEAARQALLERAMAPRSRRVEADVAAPALTEICGPFAMEKLTLAYIFRESRAPEEIIESRRVRALRAGADNFVLKITHTGSVDFRVAPEVLWGGHIADEYERTAEGRSVHVSRVVFDHPLRRGEAHEFALRHWVERDPEPATEVMGEMAIPTQAAAIYLHFLGPVKPVQAWRYGPFADELLAPGEPTERNVIPISAIGDATATFITPPVGACFGIAWTW